MTQHRVPVLELRGIEIRYGATRVVADASFEVLQGEFVTLLGPSGSGKTSLLRAVAGFITPAAGEVRLGGERINDVPPFQRDVGMVFQNYALFPHMTVAENLSFGLRMMRMPRVDIAARVDEALTQVRLREFRGRYPHQLSGGQQQRVAIARTLALRPAILLLDEPMSNLDARLRTEMRSELLALLKRLELTAVSVTHNQEEALAMSDRIIVMAEGNIRQVGTPTEIYTRPADPFVADFVGDTNVIRGRRAAVENGLVRFETDFGQPVHAAADPGAAPEFALLLIRPEAIELAREPARDTLNQTSGRLTSRAYMGAFLEMRVAVGAYEFLVKKPATPAYAELAVGDMVVLRWDPAAVVTLPPS